MGVRENNVETYFKAHVEKHLKGFSRKWKCPGHDGVPDQIPMWPGSPAKLYVEIKTADGKLTSVQEREHDRLRDVGAIVFTVYGHSGVDLFIRFALSGKLKKAYSLTVDDLR